GLFGRTGRPVRILPLGDPYFCRGPAGAQQGAEPCRGGGGARQASVPLWCSQPHHPRRATRRRLNEGWRMTALPASLVDNPRLAQWIAFQEGNVILRTGKVEIGQGVLTALAQIAADELDVALTRLRIVSGETPETPSEGFTSGSNSIVHSGSAVRLVCAE